jgi:hypothetical protein
MRTSWIALLVVAGLVATVLGAFTPPTQEQINAAANDPATVAQLIQGASPAEAASVVAAVTEAIMNRGLTAETAMALVQSLVTSALGAVPAAEQGAFATALGTACGASTPIQNSPVVVSNIQSALASVGGALGGTLAANFGTAYQNSVGNTGGDGSGGKDGNLPPVGGDYPNQP